MTDWLKQINQNLLPKLQGLMVPTDGLAAAYYTVAVLALVALAMQASWLVWMPRAGGGVRRRAVVLALLLALPAAIAFKLTHGSGAGLPLLNPIQLLNVLFAPFVGFFYGYDVPISFTRETRLSLAATLSLLLLLVVVALAAGRRGGRLLRIAGAALALGLCIFPVVYLTDAFSRSAALAQAQAQGQALFDAKCQTVGAKRLSKGLSAEGIRLTRLRDAAGDERYEDAQWQGAGIPSDRVGEAYIASFLDFKYMDSGNHPGWNSGFMNGQVTMTGFQFVDVEQADGRFLRYRLATDSPRSAMVSEEIPATAAARHAVSYTRVDSAQERANWVAGALVTVTDTETGEVLGELRTAAFAPPSRRAFDDPQRRNWELARTCPVWKDVPHAMARLFAGEVVAPVRRR